MKRSRGANGLTARQQAVLDFIVGRQRASGAPPTVREIGAHFGFTSPRAGGQYLEILERKGFLTRLTGQARNIRLTGAGAGLPILGQVPAGVPLEAIEARAGSFDPLAACDPQRHFALRVQGLSMRDAGILDGDLVVVRHAPAVPAGAIGVVYLDDEATVKYIHPTRHGLRLVPANPDFQPIEADARVTAIRIAGPVVAVWRQLSA